MIGKRKRCKTVTNSKYKISKPLLVNIKLQIEIEYKMEEVIKNLEIININVKFNNYLNNCNFRKSYFLTDKII